LTTFIQFFCNHIISILGLSGSWELQYLGPDRIISRPYSAKKNSPTQFMKCQKYLLIVKTLEFLLKVSMGRLFEGRANLAISVEDTTPADCTLSRRNTMQVISKGSKMLFEPVSLFICSFSTLLVSI
jgi:hypothetical protein